MGPPRATPMQQPQSTPTASAARRSVADMGQWSGGRVVAIAECGAAEGGDRQRPRAVRDSWVSNAADQIQRPTVLRGFY